MKDGNNKQKIEKIQGVMAYPDLPEFPGSASLCSFYLRAGVYACACYLGLRAYSIQRWDYYYPWKMIIS